MTSRKGGVWVKLSKITIRIYFVFISVFLYSIFGSVAALVPNLINPNRLLRAPAYLPAHPLATPSCPSLDYYRLIIFFSRPRCGSAGGPSKVLSTPDVEMFILLSGKAKRWMLRSLIRWGDELSPIARWQKIWFKHPKETSRLSTWSNFENMSVAWECPLQLGRPKRQST